MPEAQAEVLADEQRRMIDSLSTKDDLVKLETTLKAQLSTMETTIKAATKADIADTKAEILKWIFGTMGFQTIIILGAVLALSRFGH